MKAYLDLVRQVLTEGEERKDRTNTGTLSVFGAQTRYDLRDGFPLVTTKKVIFDSVVKELLWFLRGETNIKTLGCGIWDAWARPDGGLGPIYGLQWRSWKELTFDTWGNADEPILHDQIAKAAELLLTDPYSRRNIVSAWNVADLSMMALQPCHVMFQLYASQHGSLDLHFYQRSADLLVGVPFNIASYALLLMMFAQHAHLSPRYLIHTIGDAHVYLNHIDGARRQLEREPLPLPSVRIKRDFDLSSPYTMTLTPDDIELLGYRHYPAIKFPVAV